MLRDVLIAQGLSNRECEVVELTYKGLSIKETAGMLFVTDKTIKFHLTNIYRKLKLYNRTHLKEYCAVLERLNNEE